MVIFYQSISALVKVNLEGGILKPVTVLTDYISPYYPSAQFINDIVIFKFVWLTNVCYTISSFSNPEDDPVMMTEKEKMELITRISLDINEVKDLDLLLEKILTNVRRFFNADAGSIYLREGDNLKFSYTQNDTLRKRLAPGRKLIYNTFSIPINNRSIAGYVAEKRESVNIPDVYVLNDSVPYKFDSHFDRISNYKTRSVLTVPITNQRHDVLGVMQVINHQDDNGEVIPFSSSDEPLIKHFATSAGLAVERAQTTRNLILRMISMAELRDPKETSTHVNRVGAYSVEIFEEWAKARMLPHNEIERKKDILRMAAMLHDVGKVAISDLILKKPARLTIDEFDIMKSHTYLGARLFKDMQSDFDELAYEVALNHHEKWDGSGYPGQIDLDQKASLEKIDSENKKPSPKIGDNIPFFGRIVAISDVYDALSSRRCYKEAWDESQVLEEIRAMSGKHFDPEIVEAFFACLESLQSIAKRYADEDHC
jgi:HD-GYP domain-containing protein (c-di-GMP phosphodiesterase class II)